jgi:hypothetical protein
MSFFATVREATRRELLELVARDGLRDASSKIHRVPVEVVVLAVDGQPIDVTSRQRIEEHVAHVNGRRPDGRERGERAPTLPKVRLTRYTTDEVSRGIAQGYLDVAGNAPVATGVEPYVPGSGGPIPSMQGAPDRSAPFGALRGVSERVAS